MKLRTWAIFTGIFVLLTGIFYWVVADDWRRTAVETDMISAAGVTPVDEGAQNRIVQEFISPAEQLEAFRLIPGRTRVDTAGPVRFRILQGENALWETMVDSAELKYNEVQEFRVDPALQFAAVGEMLSLEIDVDDTGVSFQSGNSVQAGKLEVELRDVRPLSINGRPLEGTLVMSLRGMNRMTAYKWILPVAGVLYLVCLGFLWQAERQKRSGKMHLAGYVADLLDKYHYLLKTLVTRDFRIKYQASFLGVLWSFLNPLLTMFVYLFVFSTIFRQNIEYFPVYLLSGIVLFNYFSESSSLGLISIVGNRALITKVYMPKYIYPVAKVLSSAINLVISFVPLFIVMLVTGVPFHKSMLLLPLVLLFLVLFCTGVSLILSTLNVFFRDTQFLWSIMITIWNFLTPIFYPESIIPAAYLRLYHANPLYQIVYFMRCITIGGVSPTPITYLYCILASGIPLLIGALVFRWKQNQFVLHL